MPELRVTVCREDADIVNDALWAWGPSAIEERFSDGKITLVAGFADAERAEHAASTVAELASLVEIVEIADESWLDAWRDHAHPIRVGRLVIAPAWLDAPPLEPGDGEREGETVLLRLDPGRAFGSGSHATTRLMLGAVERSVTSGTRVLDVGSGSGVLAVAAAALGAVVVATDVDPAAVAATSSNASANGLAGRVAASDAALSDIVGHFDLVLANLLASIIEALAHDLVARVAPGGRLILSGLLQDRWEATTAQFPDWLVTDVDAEDGWVAITLVSHA